MKIKRFYAADIGKALREVRQNLGADAVILSNRKVDDKIEIVAAIDYDESVITSENVFSNNTKEPMFEEMKQEMHMLRQLVQQQISSTGWQKMLKTDPLHVALLNRLTNIGLDNDIANIIVDKLSNTQDMQTAWLDLLTETSNEILTSQDDFIKNGGVHALVGVTGVGKTTSLAKLAARAALHHGPDKVALITVDTFRIAAFEQLNIYGKLLGIDISRTDNPESLQRLLHKYNDKHLILIDTAGMSQRDLKLSEQLQMLNTQGHNIQCSLVLSANTQKNAIKQIIKSFSSFNLLSCIITKIDETTSLGEVYSALIKQKLPISYYTDGQRVPEDIHLAQKDSLVHLGFSIAEKYNDPIDSNERNNNYGGIVNAG